MKTLSVIAVLGLAFAAALSAAADTPPAASADSAKLKKICRETGAKTGSRMSSGRKCKTAAEWAEIDSGKKAVEVQAAQVGTISRTN